MNKTKYILLVALGLLGSCKDRMEPPYFIDEDENAIVLRAGISEGGSAGVQTRAEDGNHTATEIGGGHKLFTPCTVAALRIDGDWWKTAEGSATEISQTTTATMGEKSATEGNGQLHNSLTMSPKRYWDDYGTADPNNIAAGRGRKKGLTIYGVAVNGKTDVAPTVSNWESLSWTVSQNQSANGIWGTEDLLISNNIKEGKDGTLKFDDLYPTKQPGLSNIMEFTHALSKITVKLIAGDGFPTEGVGVTDKKFATTPDVILTSNLFGQTSKTEWAYTSYAVNVMTGEVATASNTPLAITTTTTKTDDAEFTVVKEALVMPGSAFADGAQLLSILADGNRYYVSSEKIRAAIATAITAGTHANSYTTQPGKDYIFKITLNQTGIDVTATIKDWVTVNSAEEAPIININKCYGQTTGDGLTEFAKGFTFYRSTAVGGSYLVDGNKAVVTYADNKYTMTPQLYWPNHSTHYFFRGIWPLVGNNEQTEINQNYTPVAKLTHGSETTIDVENVAYTANTFPTDLMIGMPRTAEGAPDETCKAGHTTGGNATAGICATDAVSGTHPNEGLIHMNFQYAMSQVIVKLQTSADASPDRVTFDNHTTVEIVDCYNNGKIKLSDGSSDFTDKELVDFRLTNDNNISPRETNNYANYRNVIIPQSLTNGTGEGAKDLKFRISVGDGTEKDVYETVFGIKNIKVTEGGNQKDITAWEPGKIYIYTLRITKTDIVVTATLKDWITVTASEPVWF